MRHRSAVRVAVVASFLALCCSSANLQSQASSPEANLSLGLQLLRAGHAAQAKQTFTRAISKTPKAPEPYILRGVAENQLREYREAVKDFTLALHIDPKSTSAHYNLTLSLIALNQQSAAMQELRLVLAADRDNIDAHYNLAVLLDGEQKYVDAREQLRAARRLRPDDFGVLEHLLVEDARLPDDPESLDESKEIVSLLTATTTPAESMTEAANLLLLAGGYRQALPLLRAAWERTSPPSLALDLLTARAMIGANEDAQAISLLHSIPQDATTAYLLGLAYGGSGNAVAALAAFEDAIARNPKDAASFYQTGLLYEHAGASRAQAVEAMRHAFALAPSEATYQTALGRVLLEADDAPGALHVLSPGGGTVPLASDTSERRLLLGIAEATTRGPAAAIPTLVEAVTRNPNFAAAQDFLGFCYFHSGDYAHAAESYRRAADLTPTNGILAYYTALAYMRANEPNRALPYAENAAHAPNAAGEDHYLLGKLYLQFNRRDEAVDELKTAVALKPGLEPPYYLLARAAMQAGKPAEAQAWSTRLEALKQTHNPDPHDVPLTASAMIRGTAARDQP